MEQNTTVSALHYSSRPHAPREHLRITEEVEKAKQGAWQLLKVRYPIELVAMVAILFFSLGQSHSFVGANLNYRLQD